MEPRVKAATGDQYRYPASQATQNPTGQQSTYQGAPSGGFSPAARGASEGTMYSKLHSAHEDGKPWPDPEKLNYRCYAPLPGRERVIYDEKMYAVMVKRLAKSDRATRKQHGKAYLPAPGNEALYIAQETVIKVDGKPINANRIHLDDPAGKRIEQHSAIACGYPPNDEIELGRFFQGILDEKPSVGVVLTPTEEILAAGLPPYFMQDGKYGDISVKVKKVKGVAQTDPNGLPMKRYDLEIGKDGKTFEYSVLHVEKWADGTGTDGRNLIPVLNTMREIEKNNPPSEKPRVPMVHCKAGVGRTGELIGAYLMAFDPNVRSAESLIRCLRKYRAIHMAYVQKQSAVLAKIATYRAIPVYLDEIESTELAMDIDQVESFMLGNLRHIGYDDIEADVNEPLRKALCDVECRFVECALEQAQGDVLLSVKEGDRTTREILWSEDLPGVGRDVATGEIFLGTPTQYTQQRGAVGASYKWERICPSTMACDLAIFRGRGAKETHNAMVQDFLEAEEDEGAANLVLQMHETPSFLRAILEEGWYAEHSRDELARNPHAFIAALRESNRMLLEFGDEPRTRVNLPDLSKAGELPVTGWMHKDEIADPIAVLFQSVEHVAQYVIYASTNPDKPVCMLSGNALTKLALDYNFRVEGADPEAMSE